MRIFLSDRSFDGINICKEIKKNFLCKRVFLLSLDWWIFKEKNLSTTVKIDGSAVLGQTPPMDTLATKEVIKEQPTPANFSATARRVLRCTRSQKPSCRFKERIFGYFHRTVHLSDPPILTSIFILYWRIFFTNFRSDTIVILLQNEIKYNKWIEKFGQIILHCKMFLFCSLFGISFDPLESVKVWHNRHI